MKIYRRLSKIPWVQILIIGSGFIVTLWVGFVLIHGDPAWIKKPPQEPLPQSANSNKTPFSKGGKVLIVGGDDSYPPYSYLENGQAMGFDNDLIRAIAEVRGMQVDFRLKPWAETKQDLLDGKIDIIGGMAYTDSRTKVFAYGIPTQAIYFDLFVRSDSSIESIKDIPQKTIVIQKGGAMEDYLQGAGWDVNIVEVENPSRAIKLLAAGTFDGALLNKVQGYYLIQTLGLQSIHSINANLYRREYSFVGKLENKDLILSLNHDLAVVKSIGTYDELTQKWFSVYQERSFIDQARGLIYVIFGLLVLGIAVIFWSWALRRQVKKRTQQLKESEEKYRLLVDNANEGVIVVSGGQVVFMNPYAERTLGVDKTGKSGAELLEILHPEDRDLVVGWYQKILNGENVPPQLNFRMLVNSGEICWLSDHSVLIDWEEKKAVLSLIYDVTENVRSTQALKRSEEQYRWLFTKSPVGLVQFDNELNITNFNGRVRQMLNTKPETLASVNLKSITDERVMPAIAAVQKGEDGFYEGEFKSAVVKNPFYLRLKTAPLYNDFYQLTGGIALIEDITEQIQNKKIILALEDKFSKAFEVAPDPISISSLKDGIYLEVNQGFLNTTGYSREEVIGKSVAQLGIWVNLDDRERIVEKLLKDEVVQNIETRLRFKNNEICTALVSFGLMNISGEKYILSVVRDITTRINAEKTLCESEKRYRTIFDSMPISIWEEDFSEVIDEFKILRKIGITDIGNYFFDHPDFIVSMVSKIVVRDANNAAVKMFQARSKEQLLGRITQVSSAESIKSYEKEFTAIWAGESFFSEEFATCSFGGEEINVILSMNIPAQEDDFHRVLVNIADITEHKKSEKMIHQQMQHMASLRAVDTAISSSIDLPIVLKILLNQVQQQLGVDAVSVLLLAQGSQLLEYAIGMGFNSESDIKATNLRVGESLAGRAALERRIVTADLQSEKDDELIAGRFKAEHFQSFVGVPLITKGAVKGVLEIFNRTPLKLDSEWISLLEAMANQAAIAIENASLISEIQRMNANLMLAYDATIEGWARALELRDVDTQGHSKRVADLTVELARLFGLKDSALIQVRRGALLHDIGKLGIPDRILLKPDQLTEEEWQVMRMHPIYGKELLNSIEFLRQTIDIPYYHHERWDGKGYPLGLSGEKIPISARIFSVVDCWDALRSNRPYRKAWPEKKSLNYICQNAGKAFDPEVVAKFVELMGFSCK